MNEALQKWRNTEFTEAQQIIQELVKDNDNRSLIAVSFTLCWFVLISVFL